MLWDPGEYRRFSAERSRPFYELLSRIGATEPGFVADVGCGPGELTAELCRRWPGADVLGVDSSAEMIEAAAAVRAGLEGEARDRLSFQLADAVGWRPPAPPDVLISNAMLQWLPDHEDPVLRWYEGTGLRPVIAALDEDAAAEFTVEYGARLHEHYPRQPYGTVLPFRRVF